MPRYTRLMKAPKNERIFGGHVGGAAYYLGVSKLPLRILFTLLWMMSPLVVFIILMFLVFNIEEYDKKYDRNRI